MLGQRPLEAGVGARASRPDWSLFMPASPAAMTPRQRLELVQLACVAAWSDAEVRPEEREVVRDLAQHLGLAEAERACVEQWLASGPPDFDPYAIPHDHRDTYLRAFLEVATADGRFDPEESALLRVLRELLA